MVEVEEPGLMWVICKGCDVSFIKKSDLSSGETKTHFVSELFVVVRDAQNVVSGSDGIIMKPA